MKQLSLVPHLFKGEKSNGDPTSSPVATPQQSAIFGTNIDETTSL
jgi:hypothetical protein